MLRLQVDSMKAVDTFIKRVVARGRLWVLDNDGFVAGCSSNHAEDCFVFPVFSDAALARRGAACWDDRFPPVDLPLATFTDQLLPLYIKQGSMVGPNWDGYMAGSECDPAELLARIKDALAKTG